MKIIGRDHTLLLGLIAIVALVLSSAVAFPVDLIPDASTQPSEKVGKYQELQGPIVAADNRLDVSCELRDSWDTGFVGIIFVRALDAVPPGWQVSFEMDARIKISSMWVGQLASVDPSPVSAVFSKVTVRGPASTGDDSDGSLVQGQLVEIGFYATKPVTTKVITDTYRFYLSGDSSSAKGNPQGGSGNGNQNNNNNGGFNFFETNDGSLPVGWGLSIGVGVLGLVGVSYYVARHNKHRREKALAKTQGGDKDGRDRSSSNSEKGAIARHPRLLELFNLNPTRRDRSASDSSSISLTSLNELVDSIDVDDDSSAVMEDGNATPQSAGLAPPTINPEAAALLNKDTKGVDAAPSRKVSNADPTPGFTEPVVLPTRSRRTSSNPPPADIKESRPSVCSPINDALLAQISNYPPVTGLDKPRAVSDAPQPASLRHQADAKNTDTQTSNSSSSSSSDDAPERRRASTSALQEFDRSDAAAEEYGDLDASEARAKFLAMPKRKPPTLASLAMDDQEELTKALAALSSTSRSRR